MFMLDTARQQEVFMFQQSAKCIVLSLALSVLAGLPFSSAAKADEALVLKYSGGRLVFAGIAQNIQFAQGQGFLSVDSQAFGFRDKCTGLLVRVIDDVVIKQSDSPINCNELPRISN
jgi:hypothetical protein